MALRVYNKKRDFDVTPEPRGKRGRSKGNAYVIQKHAARRLHYDLRLELDGVMLSWAVTRGPSLVPGDKRLAVHVEDHPIEYNKFEGTIPQGEYGGGAVMIWDRGTWTPKADAHAGMKKGRLDFTLDGEKLQGEWHLVRMRKRPGERQEPWLLIKAHDEAARTAKQPDILEEANRSVATGRSIDEIAAGKGRKAVWHSNRGKDEPAKPQKTAAVRNAKPTSSPERKARTAAKETRTPTKRARTAAKSKKAKASSRKKRASGPHPLPDFVPPCLASLVDQPPSSSDWVHEIKFDGYRLQARIADGKVRLLTRKALDWTARFQALAEPLAKLPADTALIDGEAVVEDEQAISSFAALQEALKTGRGRMLYYAFDLLHLNGYDLRGQPLIERKSLLEELLTERSKDDILRFSEHFDIEGPALLKHACELKLEGIVSKRGDAPYRSGRAGDWLKTTCGGGQEFVIVGFAPATNDPRAVGALLLGYYQDGKLRYAGRVGTGFTDATARDLWRRLDKLRLPASPVTPVPAEERRRDAVWVKPSLVADVDFRNWTQGERLRHPSFQGLREDKAATDVVREGPTMPLAGASKSRPAKGTAGSKIKVKARTNAETAKPGKRSAASSPRVAQSVAAAHLTHPDRVYWEDIGFTKQDLADYYAQVWDYMAPHVTGRALSLVRCPEGTSGQCFFQKHATAGLDRKRLRLVPEDGDEIIAIDDLDGLLALVQAGVLEVHVRGSTTDRLDAANRIVFDLDPAPDVAWREVKRGAQEVRQRLQDMGLESYLKTTGGKGLHVVLPIQNAPWDVVKDFARGLATAMASDNPERYIATASKQQRTGRIFVDYLRNSREATAICAYSTRAREGATVAAPIAWSELGSLATPARYTVANLMQRLKRLKRDPWADIERTARQRLPKS